MFETGTIIQLTCWKQKVTKELLVENFGGRLLLAERSNPYFRMHLAGVDGKKERCDIVSGAVEFKSGSPQFCNMFEVKSSVECKHMIVLCSKSNKADSKQEERNYALGIDKSGSYAWRSVDPLLVSNEDGNCYHFNIAVKSGNEFRSLDQRFAFQKWQLRRLVTEGYMHLPGICNAPNIDRCIATLNNALGIPGRVVAGGVQNEGIGKLAGDLSNCEALKALFHGEVEAVVDALFGSAGAEKLNLSAQIAFRFPELQRAQGAAEDPLQVESFDWHTDGLRQGHSHGFSILLGICLSDTVEDNCGNLTVWPGSHLLLHQCKVPPHGALDLPQLDGLVRDNRHFSSFASAQLATNSSFSDDDSSSTDAGLASAAADLSLQTPESSPAPLSVKSPSASLVHHDNEPADLPSLGEPLQLKLRIGDVVLLHPDLAHAGAPNRSREVRRMLYYRLRVRADRLLHTGTTIATTATAGTTGTPGARPKPGEGWEEVVRRHESDMWADLPVVRQQLGPRELVHTMRLYQDNY